MLPPSIALVEDDKDFAHFLAERLKEQGVHEVSAFGDSNDLLVHPGAYRFDFYVIDLSLPGIDGLELLKILRRRTQAGVVIVSGRVEQDVFRQVIEAGADMFLQKPVTFDQVVIAVKAVHRRICTAAGPGSAWELDAPARQLKAPDGTRIPLSPSDQVLLTCFVAAEGQPIDREQLCRQLGLEGDADEMLTATVYRLRRRVERATPLPLPLQTKAKFGYIFKGPLKAI